MCNLGKLCACGLIGVVIIDLDALPLGLAVVARRTLPSGSW